MLTTEISPNTEENNRAMEITQTKSIAMQKRYKQKGTAGE